MARPNPAAFIADLTIGIPDDEMRKRYRAGDYGKLRPDDIKGWRKLAGRA